MTAAKDRGLHRIGGRKVTDAPIKEEHLVKVTYRPLTGSYGWRCLCGSFEGGFSGVAEARADGDNHVQELGVKPLGVAFVVRQSAHGQDCEQCHQAARVAVRDLRKSGASDAVGWTAEAPEYPGQENGQTHWAKVARPNTTPKEQEDD